MKFLLFVMLCISCFAANAQEPAGPGTLTGILTDSTTNKPVPFATVALQTTDGKLITGAVTNDKGGFQLAAIPVGSYKLAFSFVGYQTKVIGSVVITTEKPAVDVGTVTLSANSKTLGEVNVVGQKALIEDKGDRLVYNAEQDATNTGGTAVDVLRKVPMLTVDLDGNLKMRGTGNIKVLVNGKPSSIMARNLADALKQMPANIIKSVEVITSPGAKYDAEGSGGVINIVTKKALKGTNGTVNATGGNLNRSLGGNINVKGKKLGLALSLNGYQYRNIGENTNVRTALADGQPTSILRQTNSRDNTGTGGYGELSLDYDPDTTNRINFSANAWGGNFPQNSQITSRLTDPAGAVLQAFRRDIQYRNPYGNTEFNLGWTKTFKKPGREFSMLTQYARMPDNYYYTIRQMTMQSESPTYLERSTNLSRNNEYTFQTDYTHPFTAHTAHDTLNFKVETGAKVIRRDIGSEFVIEQALSGLEADYAIDPARTNEFTYNQQVMAGYASLKMDTKRKWNLSAGARLEHTRIQGDFMTAQSQFSNQYQNLIPSATVSKTFRDKHTVKASYTQRISRPLIWFLNPFQNYSDPKNVQTGNPYLNPELTHATELSYSTFGKEGASFNAALFWRQTNNSIEWLSTVDANGVAFTSPKNIGQNASYGANLNISLKPNKDFTISTGAELTYVDLTSIALNQRTSGWVWNLSPNLSYKLPKDLTLQATGFVGSGWISLQSRNSGWYYYGISAKKEFMNKNASLTLNLNNPFNRTVRITGTQFAPTFTAQSTSLFVNQSARLTFSYKFGQMNSGGKQSRKITNDDSRR
ncbi:outer membrane beta-barrel family protein [Spirosoma utsteinense]|uniref:Outer membrane receptor protein involved in Fe transport n=1 Tax=Spirosoma utsteinense TaxID=2585773 RepID=A0ABR6W0I1_9BACT|nr:outer membrane beta-barrel family protein [Spirosoma utsteinense]MBC3783740.1 outer membrane receptor protein involved in Fe transport [Spirosoma utsteinense]MBC3790117.1 outer membrane receptor protein involved in Fe transport [Spirosoma utsteinense]